MTRYSFQIRVVDNQKQHTFVELRRHDLPSGESHLLDERYSGVHQFGSPQHLDAINLAKLSMLDAEQARLREQIQDRERLGALLRDMKGGPA